MSEVILLSLTASLNPTLVAATTVMLLLNKPARLMGGYLLGAYLVAPRWTPQAIARAKAWVSRHAHMFAVRGFAAVGALLVLKGLIGLLS